MAKRRKRNKAGKGSAYERELAKKLSAWWTEGRRDDVFWRTAGSGGRGKVRGRRGKETHGAHGDLCAMHPSAQAFMDFATIEIKRGYSSQSVADLLDGLDSPAGRDRAQQALEGFLQQTVESAEQAESKTWLLIQRRNKRRALVYFPAALCKRMKSDGCFNDKPLPFATIRATVQFRVPIVRQGKKTRFKISYRELTFCIMPLDRWLECVTPNDVRRWLRKWK